MAGIEIYLDRLEDPFETFPLQSVAKLLASLADEQEKRTLDRVPWLGKPHLDVEDEHDIEVVEHLIGAAFVLSQAAIAQAVSLVRR